MVQRGDWERGITPPFTITPPGVGKREIFHIRARAIVIYGIRRTARVVTSGVGVIGGGEGEVETAPS